MLTNCLQCHKAYVRNLGNAALQSCQDCANENQAHCLKVFEYLRGHSNANVEEISEGTGVPKERILKLMNERKIRLATKEQTECNACQKQLSQLDRITGTLIGGKFYCKPCVRKLAGNLNSILKPGADPPAEFRISTNPMRERRYGFRPR